jgi:hypothetical protein
MQQKNPRRERRARLVAKLIMHASLSCVVIINSLLMSALLGHLPYRLHISRTGHNPPRGPSADWWVVVLKIVTKSSSSSPYPTKWGRHNMFPFSILFCHSSSFILTPLIFMSSFTQSIHLFLGRPLLGCPSTFIVITLFVM